MASGCHIGQHSSGHFIAFTFIVLDLKSICNWFLVGGEGLFYFFLYIEI